MRYSTDRISAPPPPNRFFYVWHFELKYRSFHSDGITDNQPCQCGARARGSRDCSSLCISRSSCGQRCVHTSYLYAELSSVSNWLHPLFPTVSAQRKIQALYNVACEQYCNFTDRMAPFYDRQMLLDASSNWLTASSNVTSTFIMWVYSIHTWHQLLLKEAEIVSETSAHFSILTRMLAQQNFVLPQYFFYCYWGGTKSLVLRPLQAYCTSPI
jgi:hypothetical protein